MRKPAVFLAHGSPMSALGGDTHAAALRSFGDKHLDARGILIISAHWQVSRPLRVTAWDDMPLLYDFGGFPDELYRIQYPSPGDPGLAARIAGVLLFQRMLCRAPGLAGRAAGPALERAREGRRLRVA